MYFVEILAGNHTSAISARRQAWQTTVVGKAPHQQPVYLAALSLGKLTEQVAGLLLTSLSC
jgi:hypothetical protein